MLKPVFISNGLYYEDWEIIKCLLIEEKYIPQIMKHFNVIYEKNRIVEKERGENYINHITNKTKDRDPEIRKKLIHITESDIYNYLKENKIEYQEFDMENIIGEC